MELLHPNLASPPLANAIAGPPLVAVEVECHSSGPASPDSVSKPKVDVASPRKWTSVMCNSSPLEEIGTPSEHITGVPFVLIPDENIEEAKEEFKDFMGRIIGVVNALWARNGPQIFVHKVGFSSYLLRVQNPRTRAILLSPSVWNIAGHPMFVSPWSSEYNP
ncbi:unnamed protein product [Arabis nemorensis]|uniref:DUF4283 domain-containing protein n=1 Tax=Arabis nemorensis TaxID=586526 RepID=A0A565CQU2_9BRAS|nr:unnamed protein product [Arabis nemorensis]